jgi:hypothetical protein
MVTAIFVIEANTISCKLDNALTLTLDALLVSPVCVRVD